MVETLATMAEVAVMMEVVVMVAVDYSVVVDFDVARLADVMEETMARQQYCLGNIASKKG